MDNKTNALTEGRYVIVRKLGGQRLTLTRLKRNLKVDVENLKVQFDGVFGSPFGIYKVDKEQQLELATPSEG